MINLSVSSIFFYVHFISCVKLVFGESSTKNPYFSGHNHLFLVQKATLKFPVFCNPFLIQCEKTKQADIFLYIFTSFIHFDTKWGVGILLFYLTPTPLVRQVSFSIRKSPKTN